MNKYLLQLGDLAWSKVALLGCLLAALYYGALFDDGTSLVGRRDMLSQRLNELQVSLENTKKATADADRFEQDVKTLAGQFENIVNYMPSTLSVSDMTSIITAQARQAGTTVKKIEPKQGEEKVDFFGVTRVGVTIEGTYSQIVTFLSHLSRVPKLLIFEKSELRNVGGDPESPKLVFTGTLQGFRYIANANEKAEATAGGPSNVAK